MSHVGRGLMAIRLIDCTHSTLFNMAVSLEEMIFPQSLSSNNLNRFKLRQSKILSFELHLHTVQMSCWAYEKKFRKSKAKWDFNDWPHIIKLLTN